MNLLGFCDDNVEFFINKIIYEKLLESTFNLENFKASYKQKENLINPD